jgi:phosphatidylserine/phosphatidylglycerophosphate/cardiolipin synthase-like enzyme
MNRLELFADLNATQINDLNQLLQGPLAASWSPQYLEKSFGKILGTALFHELLALDGEGWSREKISTLLNLQLLDRRRRPDGFSWVMTGSTAPELPSRDTGVIFRSVIEAAEREILLVSYALYKGRELLAPLHQKMIDTAGFRVRMILDVSRPRGDTSLASQIIARFKNDFLTRNWPGEPWPLVFYDPRGLETEPQRKAVVHAKCVIADDHLAFVTSANLTEAAQEKNVEVGVLIESHEKVRQLKAYFEGLIEASLLKVE